MCTANPSGLGIRGVLYKLVYFQISVLYPMSVLPVFLNSEFGALRVVVHSGPKYGFINLISRSLHSAYACPIRTNCSPPNNDRACYPQLPGAIHAFGPDASAGIVDLRFVPRVQ